MENGGEDGADAYANAHGPSSIQYTSERTVREYSQVGRNDRQLREGGRSGVKHVGNEHQLQSYQQPEPGESEAAHVVPGRSALCSP